MGGRPYPFAIIFPEAVMLVDFVTELGVGLQISKSALAQSAVRLVPDTSATPPVAAHIEIVTLIGTFAGKPTDLKTAQLTYGHVLAKINAANT